MLTNHIILAMVWIVYCVLHSVLAGVNVKKQLQKMLGRHYKYYRPGYTIFSLVFLVVLLWYQSRLLTIKFYEPGFLVQIAGSLVSIAGLTVMLICIKKYFFSLSGLKTLMQESSANPLIISGIHRYVRHPLYLGTFGFIWGLFVLFPYLSLLIADVIITVYTLLAIKWEEEKLVFEFGDQYKAYQKKVPKLIPHFSFGEDFQENHRQNSAVRR